MNETFSAPSVHARPLLLRPRDSIWKIVSPLAPLQRVLVRGCKRREKDRDKIVRILTQEVYHGFGPTLGAEYLAKKHTIKIGREALRKIMLAARLWPRVILGDSRPPASTMRSRVATTTVSASRPKSVTAGFDWLHANGIQARQA